MHRAPNLFEWPLPVQCTCQTLAGRILNSDAEFKCLASNHIATVGSRADGPVPANVAMCAGGAPGTAQKNLSATVVQRDYVGPHNYLRSAHSGTV